MRILIINLTKKITSYTSRIYYFWAIIGAPIIQELVFRFIPYQFFYIQGGKYWEVGVISSVIFASIHWYFGNWFVLYTFVVGLFVYWWAMVNFGLIGAILAHSIVNILDLSIGLRNKIGQMKI